jgi:hypothetical protein
MNARATDEQLERFAAFLAKVTLEIERDLRQPELLLEVMPTRTWEQWQRGRLPGKFHGGPVMDADIGKPRIERLHDTRAIANVVTRTDTERWGALTMKLDASSGRWRAASIQRLYAARHYRTGPYPPVVEVPVGQRIAAAAQDRERASAALQASQRRQADLRPRTAAHREAKRMTDTWSRIVADLDRELAALRQRQHTGVQVQRVLKRAR